MNIEIILLQQIIVMFILMAIGFWLFKKNKITKQGSKELGSLLLYVVIPIIIIKSFWIPYTNDKLTILLLTFFISFIVLLLSILISHLFFKKDGVMNFSAAFSNAGFIGIPLVSAVLGNEAVFYIACIIAELNILQWSYGVFIMTKDKKSISLKGLTTNPIVIAFIIGLGIFILKIPQPQIAKDTMQLVSGINTPLAMLISGIYLAQADLKKMFTTPSLYVVSIVRLVIIPICTAILLMLLPADLYTVKLAILIAASAPTGSNVAIYAQQYNQDYTTAVSIVCLTTILSIITLPIVISLSTTIL